MELWSAAEREVAVAIGALGRVNPFLPERRQWERRALGDAFVPGPAVWSLGDTDNPNVDRVAQVSEDLAERVRRRLEHRAPSAEERELYGGLVFMVLYNRYAHEIPLPADDDAQPVVTCWERYLADFRRFFRHATPPDPEVDTPEHLLACFWQIRRAFELVLTSFAGGSMPAARLRAATWQSTFTHDARRYRRFLYRTMPDVPTLITGPTGTGKELVARAVGLSGYVPFDRERRRFAFAPTFLPLNLSALSPALVESELFGHRKGAFTGATGDRVGWLARCPRGGTVFLDEIGELDPLLQVKLLRVLEDRTFAPVGEERVLRFVGKIVAATHRDLARAIGEGDFRADLYYRLAGDRIVAPSLRERLDADPDELRRILHAVVSRTVGPDYADGVTEEVLAEILRVRGAAYGWPGNVRELAQVARNVVVQGTCGPPEALAGTSASPFSELDGGELPLREVDRRYARHVHARRGSYKATAEVLGVDWRTVKSLVDE
ncbi:MAG: sigma-54-dependent Fis family transcriptional regulator [Alphaproteobacteria bacterium]|nr:sigma-54-dependent Fis family transcriptional regulator [Alphaproteobacteria bacterium]